MTKLGAHKARSATYDQGSFCLTAPTVNGIFYLRSQRRIPNRSGCCRAVSDFGFRTRRRGINSLKNRKYEAPAERPTKRH